ncbi:putative quinol monooxygenase [Rhodococcus sp. NPDC059968]|uniref:putative quinol monooxygenase n=1 Tax=Rhodococcus sp. NPDC059968 TaxID=3347017 RepID=UPI0036727CE7
MVAVKTGHWDAAKEVAREQVRDANERPGTLVYEIYADESAHRLVQMAVYRDVEGWLSHSRNNPHAARYMTMVDLVSLEVHGDPTPELEELLAGFGAAAILPSVSSAK